MLIARELRVNFYLLSAPFACVLIPVAGVSYLRTSFEESLENEVGLSTHAVVF